jgi:1-deoxy-D-xylulose 5-phosphate reductoisomerase
LYAVTEALGVGVWQIREFKPKLVAIRDAAKLGELKEAIKDVQTQPEILVGDEGAIEVARYADIDAVVTGIVGARPSSGSLDPLLKSPLLDHLHVHGFPLGGLGVLGVGRLVL